VLNSFELNHIQIKSFKATQMLSTIDKYARVFTQFFCFLFRTALITNKELSFTSAIELASSKDEKRSLKKLFHLSDRSLSIKQSGFACKTSRNNFLLALGGRNNL
jgi:hypothetical protein